MIVNLFEQFRRAEETISREQGEFTLFGLFERDDVPGKFDVIISTPWLFTDRTSLLVITELVRNAIESDNWWMRIGKFVLLDKEDPFVRAVLDRMPNDFMQHDLKVINDLVYEGEIIRNAVVITAQKHPIENMTDLSALPQKVAA